ncbi:MAG: DMT family transporter [Actinomycetota bacterium]|nr:DMT family transporter [Actinomycetota bacterium]
MLGVGLMLVAAVLNAAASVLQRRAASAEPSSRVNSLKLFLDILRRPVWMLGIATMLAGFVVHAISISISRIALVQPLLVAELPLTLLLASWAFHRSIPGRDWLAILLQSTGLALFVACLGVHGGDPGSVSTAMWFTGIAVTAGAVTAMVLLSRARPGRPQAALLGAATGTMFGLNSALIAGVGAAVGAGGGLFTTWQTYVVAVVGPISFFLLQNAMQAGELVANQPGFTLLNPLVSVLWGLVVFGEQARGGPFLLGTAAGGALIVVGTVLLARSTLLDPSSDRDATARSGGRRAGRRSPPGAAPVARRRRTPR